MMTLVAAVVLTTTAQPSIESDGPNINIKVTNGGSVTVTNDDGTKATLFPAAIDPSITVTVSNLVMAQASMAQALYNSQQNKSGPILRKQLAALTDLVQNQGTLIADQSTLISGQSTLIFKLTANLKNTTNWVETNRDEVVALGVTAEDTRYELGAVTEQVDVILSEIAASQANKTGPLLRRQIAALTDLVQKIRHPRLANVYGDWVLGDDKVSDATCPDDLVLQKCTVDHLADAKTWKTNGIKANENGCSAYGHISGSSIRVNAECSNIHNVTKVVGDTDWVAESHAITCPEDTRALYCMCYSSGGNCQGFAFGFSPANDTSCVPRGIQGDHKLSAICVDNTYTGPK